MLKRTLLKRTLSFTALMALASVIPAFAEVKTVSITNPKRYVSDLTKTIDLYQSVFGLELNAKPNLEYGTNENGQRAMGTLGATFRVCVFKLPGLALTLEPVEFKGLDGHPLSERKRSDMGDQAVILTVKDLDIPMAAAKKAGLKITTVGGKPITRKTANGTVRSISYRDPDGHPFELIQPTPLPPVDPSITGNVIGAAVEITVEDLDKTLKLYRDGLGLEMSNATDWMRDEAYMKTIGIESAKDHPSRRSSAASFAGKPNGLSYVEYKGIERQKQKFRPLDPGSCSMDYTVTDLLEAIKLIKEAGGEAMGESPIMNPAGGGSAMVRMPHSTLMTISQRAPGAGKKKE